MKKSQIALALCAALALSACGGGGGGGDATSTAPGTTVSPSTPTSNPSPTSPGALGVVATSDFLAALNAQGANHLRYVTTQKFSVNGVETTNWIFVQESTSATYSYSSDVVPTDFQSFQAQLNSWGARGYRYLGMAGPGGAPLYQLTNGANSTYSYQVALAPTSAAAYEQLLNTQGAAGYYALQPQAFAQTLYEVFIKDSASSATYTNRVLAVNPNASSDYLALLNAQGANGYRYDGLMTFGGTASYYTVLAKDQSQGSATFSYAFVQTQGTLQDYVNQMSTQSAAGALWANDYPLTPPQTLYVTPHNCGGGWFCSAHTVNGY